MDISKVLDNIYIWVFLVNIESVLFLALVKYMLCSYFTQNCILFYFLEAKNRDFVTKNCWKSSYICVFVLSPKNGAIDFTKTFITQERLVVENCPTPRWIAFLMLYRLVYNIRCHFNELSLAWSAYPKLESHKYVDWKCGKMSTPGRKWRCCLFSWPVQVIIKNNKHTLFFMREMNSL